MNRTTLRRLEVLEQKAPKNSVASFGGKEVDVVLG
jgi:hypothetical protein